jgi:nitrogen fixation NifU-like protein
MKYSENTLKYYENMKNIGSLDNAFPNVGTGIVGSPLCGDVMQLQLDFDQDDRIIDAKYKVFGCVSAIASMELVTTLLKGLTIAEARNINNEDIANFLDLSAIKKHCSVLAKEVIQAATENYLSKKNKENQMITIAETAIEKLKNLIAEQREDCKGISIAVEQGGCSGINYTLSYEMEALSQKKVIESNGIKFFYDEALENMINGLHIDLVENTFGHGFVVTNKNHISCQNCSCGCNKLNDSQADREN